MSHSTSGISGLLCQDMKVFSGENFGALSYAAEADPAEAKVFIVVVPSPGKNTVLQDHTCLSIVSSGNEMDGLENAFIFSVVISVGHVDLNQIAESLIGEEDLSTGIQPSKPRAFFTG